MLLDSGMLMVRVWLPAARLGSSTTTGVTSLPGHQLLRDRSDEASGSSISFSARFPSGVIYATVRFCSHTPDVGLNRRNEAQSVRQGTKFNTSLPSIFRMFRCGRNSSPPECLPCPVAIYFNRTFL